MIKYYSYYSVGGYKEFYLGNNTSNDAFTYYLPLLQVYKKRLEDNTLDNPALKEEVNRLSSLVSIKEVSEEDDFGLSAESAPLFTCDGYALLYKHLVGDNQVIAIRDIPSLDKDSLGRDIPFLFCLVCDSKQDWDYMDRIVTYFVRRYDETRSKIASLLHMDTDANGLRFAQKDFTEWLEHSANEVLVPRLRYDNGKVIEVRAAENSVALLVKPIGVSIDYVLEKQNIKRKSVKLFISLDQIKPDGELQRLSNKRQWLSRDMLSSLFKI